MEEKAVPEISFDEFKKMEMCVGVVKAIEDHPNADKLYIFKIDIGGGEERQTVAGLKPYYEREALIGKRVIVVTNLASAVLRGVESRGMLLAAQEGDRVVILTTDEEMPAGARVL